MTSLPSPASDAPNATGWPRFLDLSSSISSHDRFNAMLAAIKPAEFEQRLLNWSTALHELTGGQVIAIDGKTLRRSFDAADSKAAQQMVIAWSNANEISAGQVAVDSHSNEVAPIPRLLALLDLQDTLVTIDVVGCQTEIAQQIVDAATDYCLQVKANQPTLHDGIAAFFKNAFGGRLRGDECAAASHQRHG